MKDHHHPAFGLISFLFILLSLPLKAQTHSPSGTDSLLQAEQTLQAAETLIHHYEALRLREEMRFTSEGIQPLVRGIVMSITERGYQKSPAPFSEPADKTDLIDYVPAAAPLATAWILRAAGVESRSSLRRMATATGVSLALAGGLTLGLNHFIDEMSPDESSAHALPSGHAALAFTSATLLSREYGHYSPWVSIGSYTCATASQALRLYHHRHWINDIFVGAGIGIVSTNLAYYLSDLIYGADGINRIEMRRSDLLRTIRFIDSPTGLKLVSGTEVGNRRADLPLTYSDAATGQQLSSDAQITTSASFAVGLDLNWYLTPCFSIDAILRGATSTAKVTSIGGRPVEALAATPAAGTVGPLNCVYAGERIGIYHADLAAHFSAAVNPTSRVGVRGIAGLRHTTSCTFSPVADTRYSTLHLPGQTRFELGLGLDIELLSHRNYLLGFTGDYYHTFNAILSNRYSICSFWKVLF